MFTPEQLMTAIEVRIRYIESLGDLPVFTKRAFDIELQIFMAARKYIENEDRFLQMESDLAVTNSLVESAKMHIADLEGTLNAK